MNDATPVNAGTILTRIFILENGDLLVTDLWDDVRAVLEGPEEKDSGESDAPRTGL